MNIIELDEVYKSYDGALALRGVSLRVPQGIVYGVLGPHGAGKTTLIHLMLDFCDQIAASFASSEATTCNWSMGASDMCQSVCATIPAILCASICGIWDGSAGFPARRCVGVSMLR